ncbi:MAG: TIM barrel protein [Chitinivibrionales bacterium]|nr:TIM barrel protein [Chitinivibrionales bacterium]
MKIACSMSAFKGSIDNALERIRAMGFEYVDLIAIPGWDLVDPQALAERFEETAGALEESLRKSGLTPVAINAAVPTLYQRDDQETNRQRLAQVAGICRLMQTLHIPVASFFPGGNWPAQEMDWDKVLEGQVETLREMLDLGTRYGVTLTVEPHANTPFQTLEQVTGLLEAVPELRVAYDPSHFAMQSIAPEQTAGILARAAHVHVRDAGPGKMQHAVGEGTVDFEWILNSLRQQGYEGAVSIEYLPGMEAEIPRMKELLEREGNY